MTVMQSYRLAVFKAVWRTAARLSKLDDRGGSEFRRVLDLYQQRGYPRDAWSFILRWANIGPITMAKGRHEQA